MDKKAKRTLHQGECTDKKHIWRWPCQQPLKQWKLEPHWDIITHLSMEQGKENLMTVSKGKWLSKLCYTRAAELCSVVKRKSQSFRRQAAWVSSTTQRGEPNQTKLKTEQSKTSNPIIRTMQFHFHNIVLKWQMSRNWERIRGFHGHRFGERQEETVAMEELHQESHRPVDCDVWFHRMLSSEAAG